MPKETPYVLKSYAVTYKELHSMNSRSRGQFNERCNAALREGKELPKRKRRKLGVETGVSSSLNHLQNLAI